VNVSARERRLLSLLGLIAGVALLRWVWSAASPPATAAPGGIAVARGRSGRAVRAPAATLPDRVVAIRSDRLEVEPRPFEVGRDVFRFGAPPPPPPPTAEELEAQRQAAELLRRQAEAAAIAAAVPRPPAVTLRYLGSFGPERKRIAVFTASDGTSVLNALEGEVIEGKFVVLKIGFESVELGFVGFPDAPPRRLGPSG
jgi:hypothetical protein